MNFRIFFRCFLNGVWLVILSGILNGILNGSLSAQTRTCPFDSVHWDLTGARLTQVDQRTCMMGTAVLKSPLPADFSIAFDIFITGARSYPGVVFRKTVPGNFERIYFRPHLPPVFQNVIQYVSIFNNIDSWQLYTGPGNTASADLPKKRWFRVRLDVVGFQASLFIDTLPDPVLVVSNLRHGIRPGTLELGGPVDGSVLFANVLVTGHGAETVDTPRRKELLPGILSRWELSPVMKMADVDIEQHPAAQGIGVDRWLPVACRDDGIVDISQHYALEGATPNVVFAKTTITSGEATGKLFSFGYSDIISVFLNGDLLFMGNSAYTSRDPSFQGIVGLNDYINLPLKKGDNELMIALTESFGGWGFVFQDSKAVFQDAAISKSWEIKTGWRYPESVVYDRERDQLYISNFFNDGKEFISSISVQGEIIEKEWIVGLNRPAGMCIDGDKLFVVCRQEVVEVDLAIGEVTNRYPIPRAGFPNGITTDENGTVFITDSYRNCIYRLAGHSVEEWLVSDDLARPNGILFHNNHLLVGTAGDASLKQVDTSTRQIDVVAAFEAGSEIDGIRPDGADGVFVSDYKGRLYYVLPEKAPKLLLDTRVSQQFCAAFEFITTRRLFVLPTFIDNKIVAYRLENISELINQ